MFLGLLSLCSLTPKMYGQDYKKQTDCQIKSLRQNDSLTRIELIKLNTRLDYVEKTETTRYDDLIKILSIIVSLIVVIVGAVGGVTYFKGQSTAKEAAEKQFKESFIQYRKRIKAMESEAKAILERIKGYESSIMSINDNLKTIDKPTLDKISSLLDIFKLQVK
jgi:hypothetical protein